MKFKSCGVVHESPYESQNPSIWVFCEDGQPMFASSDLRPVPKNSRVTCIACIVFRSGWMPTTAW